MNGKDKDKLKTLIKDLDLKILVLRKIAPNKGNFALIALIQKLIEAKMWVERLLEEVEE